MSDAAWGLSAPSYGMGLAEPGISGSATAITTLAMAAEPMGSATGCVFAAREPQEWWEMTEYRLLG